MVAMFSGAFSICFGIALAFSPNIYILMLLRFLLAFSFMPATVAFFVYGECVTNLDLFSPSVKAEGFVHYWFMFTNNWFCSLIIGFA